jgi:hypothetical protein
VSSNIPHEEQERLTAEAERLGLTHVVRIMEERRRAEAAHPLRERLAADEKDRLARVASEARPVTFRLGGDWVLDTGLMTMTYAEAKMLQFELNTVLTRLEKKTT